MKQIKLVLCFSLFIFHYSLSFAQTWLWGAQGTTPLNIHSGASAYQTGEDKAHSAYICGIFTDSLYFGAQLFQSNQGEGSAYLAKFDNAGNYKWCRTGIALGGIGRCEPHYLCTDAANNVIYTGNLSDSVVFGPDTLSPYPYNLESGFIVKYDSAGNLQWAFRPTGRYGTVSQSLGVTTDRINNVYTVGIFKGALIIGADTVRSNNPTNASMYFMKSTPGGRPLWLKQVTLKGSGNIAPYGISSDTSGNVYVTGFMTNDTVYFGPDTLLPTSQYFLFKYDSAGNELWAKEAVSLAVNSNATGYAVTVDGKQNPAVSGTFSGIMKFDTLTVYDTAHGYWNSTFVASYTPSGKLRWFTQSANVQLWQPQTISSDSLSDIFLASYGANALSKPDYWIKFGRDSIFIDSASTASLIEKFDSSGTPLCGEVLPNTVNSSIASDPSGNNIYYCSSLYQTLHFGPNTLGHPYGNGQWPFVAKWQACDIAYNVSVTGSSSSSECHSTGSATVGVIGGTPPFTYIWAPGGATTSTATGLSSGTYTITVIDNMHEAEKVEVTITQPVALNLSATLTSSVSCFGGSNGSASSHINGGLAPYTYLWSNSSTNNTASALSAGTYTLQVTDKNGCTITASVNINEPAQLSLNAFTYNTTDSVCQNNVYAVVSGGTLPYTYLWTPGGSTGDTAKNVCDGNYCCVITDKNGCTQSACINLTTSVETINNSSAWKVYPNPSTGIVNCELLMVNENTQVQVYNVLGEKVYSQFTTHNSQFTIDLSSNPNGIYLYRIISDNGSLIGEGKLIIQK